MTEETAKGLCDYILPQLQREYATTCKVLAAVPADTCNYKPSEKCMTGLELASHIALADAFFLRGVINGAFEWKQQEFKTPGEVLAFYQETVPGLMAQIADLPGAKLAQDITFATWTHPAITYLSLNMSHGIHHRGQLSAYLRPMGAKVPSIYGPSADEAIEAAAAH
ncbi:MAG TPA: DinB family protein [Bryobacteraceae bacterium]|nr:DinB family protein [Bryobacteraceae bacterium]